MARRILLAALITLISFAEVAHADIFAGGPVYGGNIPDNKSGVQITCRIFNAGASSVTINLTEIWANVGPVTISSNTCLTGGANPPLGIGKYCAFNAFVTGNFAYSCRVNANGTDVNIRGVAEVMGASGASFGHILAAMPLQK